MEYVDYVNTTSFTKENTLRYTKKSWVPNWLWNLFAEPDYVDMISKSFGDAKSKLLSDLLEGMQSLNEEDIDRIDHD